MAAGIGQPDYENIIQQALGKINNSQYLGAAKVGAQMLDTAVRGQGGIYGANLQHESAMSNVGVGDKNADANMLNAKTNQEVQTGPSGITLGDIRGRKIDKTPLATPSLSIWDNVNKAISLQ